MAYSYYGINMKHSIHCNTTEVIILLILVGLFVVAYSTNADSLTSPSKESPLPSLANHLLVVYNREQLGSEALARFYAKARKLPEDRLLGVSTVTTEIVSREEFTQTILRPIENFLIQKALLVRKVSESPLGILTPSLLNTFQNQIHAIVLIRGIPLRIAEDPSLVEPFAGPELLKHNNASVDSELALLPTGSWRTYGPIKNPYYNDGTTVNSSRHFRASDATSMIMVTRLDGPTNKVVRQRIQDMILAEKRGLQGAAYIDARGFTEENQGYYEGDEWLRNSVRFLKAAGIEVSLEDSPELFSPDQTWAPTAIYAGWYTDTAQGPMLNPGTLIPGSIAYHIHSYSAHTLQSTTQNWCGPLINAGAGVTLGAVDEPYLSFMPNWDLFIARLLEGYTLAEAAYQSIPVLSWKIVVIGDPLYRPFKKVKTGNLPDPIRIIKKRPQAAQKPPDKDPSHKPKSEPQTQSEPPPLDPALKPFEPVIKKPAL
jgi:uncharacterized protein (TIGR03790 family)